LSRQAQSGDAKAAFRLYEYYSIAKPNKRQAIHWLALSAKLGCVAAQYNYGFWLRESKSPEDNREAANWFRVAADAGHRSAQEALAELLETGKGITMDLVGARVWYEKAARAGDYEAGQKMIEFLSEGKGGSTDRVMAYAWAGLLCSRLRGSVTGSSVLKIKERLASELTADELRRSEQEFATLEKSVLTEEQGR
jgi:TPR repeat protein